VKDGEAGFGGIARWMWWSEEIVMPSQLSSLIVVSVGLGACLWAHRRPTRRMKRELDRSGGFSSMSSTHENNPNDSSTHDQFNHTLLPTSSRTAPPICSAILVMHHGHVRNRQMSCEITAKSLLERQDPSYLLLV
jgi:hypothetical protein